ncbi:hypothetical protein [Sphingomonas qomolangmaensis]|uniref:Uncharacterized protein n=1 Tax=Sphingomonas qomolangmaensis TaxID=2918765 RepID=A0ABY5L5Z4_9SPHN|nr:hypothetical protein [Sphingomonas qomolangmaensis]UUL81401.1 hypothetical protein NMP03_09225 [Sphingomonas qomolangmaensis]
MKQRLTRQRMDMVGPFHPYLVFAGIILFDVLLIGALAMAVVVTGDKVEDVVAPGGPEWVTL